MYLTTTISISLVLLLVGAMSVLLLATNSLTEHIRENVTITVVLNDQADSTQLKRMDQMLDVASYCKDYDYISKEQALQLHIESLGEDPTKFLGYNPLYDSYEIHPTAIYAHPDSVKGIEERLSRLPYVEQVIYQEDVLHLLDQNFNKAAMVLLVIAGILLFIAIVLITNTIRLQIYSKRFLIRTMSLVGATPWMIRGPFVWRNISIGIIASIIAICILAGSIYYVTYHLNIILFALNWQNIAFLVGTILLSAILITMFSALISTGRYLRMNTDTMYRI